MPLPRRTIPRLLMAVAALSAGSMTQLAVASAHVHATSDNAVRGATAIVTFQVPNESNTGATTTALTVALPDVASARTETVPGWTAKLDRDAASGGVHSVTWTAVPGGGIAVDQFALFRISMKLPDTATVSFPATQTYSDGTVVKWDQQPPPGGGEPEYPAPALSLGASPAGGHDHHQAGGAGDAAGSAAPATAPDNTARVLGGAALVLAAAGIAVVLVRRRA